jgi:4-hydroxybenzoate polyprenyltransferase
MKWNAYWRLMRLNKPIGILLLWYPTAWGLWAANRGMPSIDLILIFLLGTIIMRSAGCVINDIADRHVDKHVSRTKLRPLTSGEISLLEAFTLLAALLVVALIILLFLPKACFLWALIALLITFVYPFCKRFVNAPQMVLGLAFSMGIPMAYAATKTPMDEGIYLLCLINFCWIVAYDTMYAMVDKEDDLKIGVKSTAIYFANYDRLIIGLLQISMQALWAYWGMISLKGWSFAGLWLVASFVLVYQQILISDRQPLLCFQSFLISSYYGFIMWLAVIL